MIRFSAITVLLLLLSFVIQQFIPAFTGLHDSRILLVHVVFLCCALSTPQPTTLLLAFIAGLLWDANCVLAPSASDPSVYTQPVESLRFGYSILLFGLTGLLMQGIRPLYREGRWPIAVVAIGFATFIHLFIEYLMINFIRGDFVLTREVSLKIAYTSLFSILLAPVILLLLHFLQKFCDIEPIVKKSLTKPIKRAIRNA